MRGTPYLSAWRHTVSDCGSTPATESNSAIAPSRTRRERSTSTVKSTWPGVSMMLMRWSSHSHVGAAGVVEDALGRRGLARVDVGHDPDVPGLLERELARHEESLCQSGQKKRAPRARTNFLRGLCPDAGLCVECLHRKKAHAWAAAPAARLDYSIRPVAASAPETTVPSRLTRLLLVPSVLGAVMLIVAEFLPLYEIRVITAVPNGGQQGTGAHHGYAL